MADQAGAPQQDKPKSGLKPQQKTAKRKQLVSIRRGTADTESAEDRPKGTSLLEHRAAVRQVPAGTVSPLPAQPRAHTESRFAHSFCRVPARTKSRPATLQGGASTSAPKTGIIHAARVNLATLTSDVQLVTEPDPNKSYIGKKFTIQASDSLGVRFKAAPSDADHVKYTEEELKTGSAPDYAVERWKKDKTRYVKRIPNGTEVTVTAYQDNWIQLEGYGWIPRQNIVGEFIDETLGSTEPEWESQAPNHKTVGDTPAIIREPKGLTFTVMRPKKKGTFIRIGTKVRLVGDKQTSYHKSGSVEVVKVASETGALLGWTSLGNLKQEEGSTELYKVVDPDARLRRDPVALYEEVGGTIPQGTFVIVKQESQDTEPKGLFVQVAFVKTEDGKKVEDTGKKPVWIAGSNLVGGWADIKGPHATWERGTYTGQVETVDIVSFEGKIQQVTPEMLRRFNTLKAAAAGDGVTLHIVSGFRDYPTQERLRQELGAQAAQPGRSRHQSGIALDLNAYGEDSAEYKWLKANATDHGFIRTVSTETWHWVYSPERIKTKEVTKGGKKYIRTYFTTFSNQYVERPAE